MVMDNNFRKCNNCQEIKELNTKNFRFSKKITKKAKGYFRRECLACQEVKRKLPENVKKERALARMTYQTNLEKEMLKRAYLRSKRDNLKFNIDIEDIFIPKKCPILNIDLKQSSGKANDFSPSLDKINPSLGYVKGNVRVISRMANIMKAHATIDQLITFSKNIIIYLNEQAQYKSDKLLENPEKDNQQPI